MPFYSVTPPSPYPYYVICEWSLTSSRFQETLGVEASVELDLNLRACYFFLVLFSSSSLHFDRHSYMVLQIGLSPVSTLEDTHGGLQI